MTCSFKCFDALDEDVFMRRTKYPIHPDFNMEKYSDTPMCNSRDMEKYDRLYIQDEKAGKREYMSPMDAVSLADLPPAYIETAEFDCLRDGGIQYAERLEQDHVPVE